MKKIRCFVAMAFAKKDTRILYIKSIKPALLELGIEPRCLLFMEHNDDINNKIISELKSSDLAVVDLTYARQSVYYEAGYAERHVPVTYLCRRDFVESPNGDNKVHFDLQMKNLITWVNPDSIYLRRQLIRRIKHIARPLFLSINKKRDEDEKSKEFFALSIHTKLELLKKNSEVIADQFGYIPFRRSDSNIWWGIRKVKGIVSLLVLLFSTRFNKSFYREFNEQFYKFRIRSYHEILNLSSKKDNYKIYENIILCSLDKVLVSRLRDAFPLANLSTIDGSLYYNFSGKLEFKDKSGEYTFKNVFRHGSIHIIDSIPFIDRFEFNLQTILNLQTNYSAS